MPFNLKIKLKIYILLQQTLLYALLYTFNLMKNVFISISSKKLNFSFNFLSFHWL